MEYSVGHECGTKEKSESPTGIEPKTRGEWGHIYWVRYDTRPAYC